MKAIHIHPEMHRDYPDWNQFFVMRAILIDVITFMRFMQI